MISNKQHLTWLLSGVVAALVLAYATYQVMGAFDEREEQLTTLQNERSQKEKIVKQGELGVRKLKGWETSSLPATPALASSLYKQWLHEKAVALGFVGATVSPGPGRPRAGVYLQHTFNLDGQADLRQVTQLLREIYSVGYLHRVGRISLKPLAGKKQLDVFISIEALSLVNAANPAELTLPPSERFASQDLTKAIEAIVNRNFFAPANNPPKLASPGTQQGNPNRSLTFLAKASDADPLDKLKYEIEGASLDGAKIDPVTGEFRWTPTKNGEYEVAIRVTDDGLPMKSSVEKVKLAVTDPPPPAPVEPAKPKKLDFDPAMHSVLTAIVGPPDHLQIWVLIRTDGKLLRLYEGDKLAIGSLSGVVKKIRTTEAEIALDDGTGVTLRIGKPLVAADAGG